MTHAAVGGFLAAFCVGAAPADHLPVIVVPGKPGVPVVIDGVEASGAVVFGDWGLYRAGHGQRVILNGYDAPHGPPPGGFYPYTGRAPRYGRQEVEPLSDRSYPAPARDFFRVWSTKPEPGPVTEYPPFDPPPVILAPRGRR